jgi:hypothetical protein
MFKVNRLSERAESIRSARSVKELAAIISTLSDEVKILSEDTEHFLQSVSSKKTKPSVYTIAIASSKTNRIELGDLDDQQDRIEEYEAKKVKKKREAGTPIPASDVKLPSVTTKLTSFTAPDLKEIAKENETLHKLEQHIAELEIAEQVLMSSTFTKMENNRLLRQNLRASINLAKTAVEDQLKAMSKIARETRPKHHNAMIKGVVEYLTDVIDKRLYSAITQNTFVYKTTSPDTTAYVGKSGRPEGKSIDRSKINYQTFIHIKDLVTVGGHVRDDYSIVVTGSIDIGTGELSYHVISLTSDKIPGSFPIGKPLSNTAEMKRLIGAMLTQDMGNPTRDRVAVGLTTSQMKRIPEFASIEYVDQLRQVDDFLIFRLVKGLSKEEELEAKTQIAAAVDRVYYNKIADLKKITSQIQTRTRPNMREEVGRNSRRKYIRVAMVSKTKHDLTRDKIKKLGTELHLKPEVVNEMLRTIQ